MGVDDAKRRRLVLQIGENAHQHDVLDDVGKAAGMKGVTVVHGKVVTTSLRAERSNPWRPRTARCIASSLALLAMTAETPYPPRIGGISTWSRRQARRSISSQGRNCRSLLMQIRTSPSRALLQVTAIAELLRPGLTLMKASSISAGATVFGSDSSRYSGGILTAERALRMVSK